MKKILTARVLLSVILLSATVVMGQTQVVRMKVIDNGSSGPYKAIAAAEATLPTHTVYRPEDIAAAFEKEGKLPVLVFANGGCSDTSITHERVLSEIASRGYIVIAIGALQMTPGERRSQSTQATMLTDAIDWITAQNGREGSAYYGKVDLSKIAAGGQSCGGAQVLAVASDPRIKAYMMFNSGMGDMSMAGASKESLANLHGPIVYIVGGESDVATANAQGDYQNIGGDKPVALANLLQGGHMGTFGEEYGGSFARMALKWLDWQLKGENENAAVFLNGDLEEFPGWTMKAKNFSAGPKEIKVTKDIAYRDGDSDAWKLDMAVPVDSGNELRPALVIVHGGGWASGSKSVDVYQNMMVDYARKGYVTINVEYRLTGEAPFPACIEDCKCAVRWLRAHADQYRVDPDRIGAYGHSAGAHLALMLAMVPKSVGLEGDGGWDDYSSRVNVAAAGSPPTELGRDTPMAKTEWWPIGYISGDQPPLFLIQGSADRIVRAELTDDFVEKMRAEGADIQYLKIDGVGHGVAYAERLEVTDPALEEFFAKHLKADSSQEQAESEAPVVIIEDGGTGPHSAIVTEDSTLPGMTIFRPRDLSPLGDDQKLPVLLWGNGACANTTQEHKNFLNEIASNGYLILAIGLLDQIEVRDASSRQLTRSSQLLAALDWILAENASSESVYFGKVDVSEVAAMGMSCGGLQAIEISGDPRISTTIVCNSGVLPEPSPMAAMPPLTKEDLMSFHAPVLYLMGGPTDIAYDNAMDDFSRIEHVPVAMANLDVGHAGTYARPHGGEFTPVALAWLDWQLKDRKEASKMFLGDDSELNRDADWTVETKNFD